jgi:ankyrin repeat protein
LTKDWLEATSIGDVARVQALLETGADIDALDTYGQTALMNAARRGDAALAKALTGRGADLNHRGKYGLTALMIAVIGNHSEVVRLLVEGGADTTIPGTHPGFARPPREYAEAAGHADIVRILSGASPG